MEMYLKLTHSFFLFKYFKSPHSTLPIGIMVGSSIIIIFITDCFKVHVLQNALTAIQGKCQGGLMYVVYTHGRVCVMR